MRAAFQGLSVAILSLGVFGAPTIVGPQALTAAYAVCFPNERIDGRTADIAPKKYPRPRSTVAEVPLHEAA